LRGGSASRLTGFSKFDELCVQTGRVPPNAHQERPKADFSTGSRHRRCGTRFQISARLAVETDRSEIGRIGSGRTRYRFPRGIENGDRRSSEWPKEEMDRRERRQVRKGKHAGATSTIFIWRASRGGRPLGVKRSGGKLDAREDFGGALERSGFGKRNRKGKGFGQPQFKPAERFFTAWRRVLSYRASALDQIDRSAPCRRLRPEPRAQKRPC
jgi:hypothetical protein